MAVPNIFVTLGGTNYPIPQPGSTPWGQNVTNWIIAACGASGFLQANGTVSFTYLKSATANAALAGALRLANSDTIDWRNFGNTADDKLFPGIAANSQSADDLYYTNGTTAVTTQLTGNPFAEYNTVAGQSIPNSTVTTINYGTLVTDTDSAVTTGASWKFTVPANKGGVYRVSANATLSANQAGTAGQFFIVVQVNGTTVDVGTQLVNSALAVQGNTCISVSTEVNVAAAATISVAVSQSSTGGGAVTLNTNAFYNRITIKRVS